MGTGSKLMIKLFLLDVRSLVSGHPEFSPGLSRSLKQKESGKGRESEAIMGNPDLTHLLLPPEHTLL